MTVNQRANLLVEVPDDLQDFQRHFMDRGWGDGLPLIPPTAARVDAMLAGCGRARYDIVATLPPSFAEATVERVAINAVLAGCAPKHLPVVIAAVEAMADAQFNLQAIQVTTHSVAVCLVVSGPAAKSLGMNSGTNCLGQGNWANATIGRALHLVMQNVGGAVPGDLDRSTHGQPGKYTLCFAENEASNPWEPLHVERGHLRDESAVTVVGVGGTLSMNSHSKVATDLLKSLADSIAYAASNDYCLGGEPWLVLSPEHADIFHKAGLNKMQLKQLLWESSRMSGSRMAAADLARTRIARAAEFASIGEETLLPPSPQPSGIGLVVAGGPGTHSVYMPSFGDTRAVSRRIDPLLLEQP